MSAHTPVWHDRTPAPGRLALIQDFVNTCDLEESTEGFASIEATRSWLVARRLFEPDLEFTEADRLRLIALREAIRELLRANSGGTPDPAAITLVNREVERARLRPTFDQRGRAALAATADGLERAVGMVLAAIVEATGNGNWARLKTCDRPTCRWVFWDASRSRGGRWCTMAVCGNRAKVSAYRRRRRPDANQHGSAAT